MNKEAILLAATIALGGTGCVEITKVPSPSHTIFQPIPEHFSPNPNLGSIGIETPFEKNPSASVFPTQTPETTTSSEIEQSEKPNIVVIMLDDINPMDGRLWTKERMPGVYATFVERGIEFIQFYGETPLCCPGRVNSLTGQHTQNHGVLDNEKGYPQRFNPKTTIATELQDQGYVTMIVGKYLNGFDKFDDKTPDGWTYQAIPNVNNTKNYDYWLVEKAGWEYYGSNEEDYSTDVFARKTIEYMKMVPIDRPMFVWLAPNSTHDPYEPAKRYQNDKRCQSIGPWKPSGYDVIDPKDPEFMQNSTTSLPPEGHDLIKVCKSILAVDDMVREVIEELERQGRLNNTVLIFTADNGVSWGDHRLENKNNPYSTKLPLYISWKEVMGNQSRKNDEVYSNIDLAPTLAEAAGVEMGPYPNGQKEPDGISFYDSLIDPRAKPNIENIRGFILESHPSDRSVIPLWWAIRATEASRLGNYRFIEYETNEMQLYDLNKDPNQIDNIAYESENSDLVSKLRKILNKLKRPFNKKS